MFHTLIPVIFNPELVEDDNIPESVIIFPIVKDWPDGEAP